MPLWCWPRRACAPSCWSGAGAWSSGRRTWSAFGAPGQLDLTSNVQFGEGGAGAFSDGKLNTGTKDLRHRFILEQLVACGAPEDILIDAKPHVGTDYLHIALRELRRHLLELGADIRFESLPD